MVKNCDRGLDSPESIFDPDAILSYLSQYDTCQLESAQEKKNVGTFENQQN